MPDVVAYPVEEPVNHAFTERTRTVCGLRLPAGLVQSAFNPSSRRCPDCEEHIRWSLIEAARARKQYQAG